MAFFQDKVAIITGAGSGIGSETAVRLSERGAMVVLSDRNAGGLQETRSKCVQAGGSHSKILLIPGDLTVTETITAIIHKTVDTFGAIDILINNAADLKPMRPLETTTTDDVMHLYQNNTMTAFNMTKMAMPHLLTRRGCVVNVSSLASSSVIPGILPYSMAKAAMDNMTQSLAMEYAPKGVRINSINAGYTLTPMFINGDYVTSEAAESTFFATAAKDTPMQRVGRPFEIASAILFLASDQASFITGSLMPVDGGLSYCLQGTSAMIK